jgi:hypothetical protein
MGIGLIWFGRFCLVSGLLMIAANAALYFMGMSASYNIGDPSQFQFILVSLWHIGVAVIAIGASSILLGRRL